MSDKIVHVLCEGQTEQGFVDEVLKPYMMTKGISSVKSILVTTNKKKNARGGLDYLPQMYAGCEKSVAKLGECS